MMRSLIVGSLVFGLASLAAGFAGVSPRVAARRPTAGTSKFAPQAQAWSARTGEQPYIVQFRSPAAAVVLARRAGIRLRRDYPALAMAAVSATGDAVRLAAASPEVLRVSPDLSVRRATEFAIPAVSADLAQAAGRSGEGVGIAVIDTGIGRHLDLGVSFSEPGHSRVVAGYDFLSEKPQTQGNDDCGHGTMVAGVAAGNAFWSSQSHGHRFNTRRFVGVAPQAHLLNLRVLDANGQGDVSTVLAALDWCLANRTRYNLRVVNLSMGHVPGESYRTDPLCQAVERLWKDGVVVVCAAGNRGRKVAADPASGTAFGTINSPGNDPYVIAVGASKDNGTAPRGDDWIATYSSRGPSRFDHVVKPDLVAPGNLIINLRDPVGTLDDRAGQTNLVPLTYYWNQAPEDRYSREYFLLSGSSLSTAMVSGAVALMLQQDPSLSPDTVKARLMLSARKLWRPDGRSPDIFSRGAGLLDVVRALSCTFVAHSPALSPWAERRADGILIHLGAGIGGEATVWAQQALWGDEGISHPDDPPPPPDPVTADQALWGDEGFSDVTSVGAQQALWGDEGFSTDPASVWADQALWGDEGITNPGDPPGELPAGGAPPRIERAISADLSPTALQGER